jgi:hypothetical protein
LTLLVAAAAAFLLAVPAAAAVADTPDPYIDALAPDNDIPVTDPQNLFGPPDDLFALVSGRQFRYLVLDLGAGEEGVGNLEVRYKLRPVQWPDPMWVDFLDRNGRYLGQGMLGLEPGGLNPTPRVATVRNPSTRPYRYVRISTGVQDVWFDSMRAAALAP